MSTCRRTVECSGVGLSSGGLDGVFVSVGSCVTLYDRYISLLEKAGRDTSRVATLADFVGTRLPVFDACRDGGVGHSCDFCVPRSSGGSCSVPVHRSDDVGSRGVVEDTVGLASCEDTNESLDKLSNPRGSGKKWEKRQRQKQKKGRFLNDWRVKNGGDLIEQDQTPGTFWNSTSKQVRQELIDSKAKMHIAENKRREREALDKIAYLESPEAAMHKAIGMIDYAQKQAKKENDNKVYGWAKTVATSSAESLARSTPDSVPSFDEVSARIEASSQSSFELELKAKQDELDDERRKNALLENEIREEKKAKEEVVAKSKHEAVVHRMRQLETQISENNKKAERVNFRRNRVEEMRNAQGETEKQMRARMAKLSPEEHQREVVRLMRERAWENS